ncbi:hypothetical protein [Paracoccus jiaweipingae]|uniref:hypothetical protein n=1 Tax=unclassified Paracoccus (in: a-proteobacteria) TaxID=2688777 RepID=UPI00379F213F
MRQIVINSLDLLAWVLGGILVLGAIATGFGIMTQKGFLAGLLVMVGGVAYAVLMLGMIFIAVGIHNNTKRTALAVEELLKRQ